jgi:hypothetical protein
MQTSPFENLFEGYFETGAMTGLWLKTDGLSARSKINIIPGRRRR